MAESVSQREFFGKDKMHYMAAWAVSKHDYDHTHNVGALKNGYIRKVPLPWAPRIQSTSHMQHVYNPGYYAQVPCIPTWSDLTRSLAGLSRSVL
jgi:hypothetical protein